MFRSVRVFGIHIHEASDSGVPRFLLGGVVAIGLKLRQAAFDGGAVEAIVYNSWVFKGSSVVVLVCYKLEKRADCWSCAECLSFALLTEASALRNAAKASCQYSEARRPTRGVAAVVCLLKALPPDWPSTEHARPTKLYCLWNLLPTARTRKQKLSPLLMRRGYSLITSTSPRSRPRCARAAC